MKCHVLQLPIAFGGQKSAPDSAVESYKKVLTWTQDFLKPTGFLAGTEGPTLADYALLAIYTTVIQTEK